MGLSFYLLETEKPVYDSLGRPKIPFENELGTREEAGWFCDRDKITLCKEGSQGIHHPGANWYPACPDCGAQPDLPGSHIRWAHSFTWDLPAGTVLDGKTVDGLVGKFAKAVALAQNKGPGHQPIIDDEGSLYSVDEFFSTLGACQFRFNEPIRSSS